MKTPIKYKVYKQSAEMGGKFYGVVNNSDPVNAELTMQQIIEARKLYGYTGKGLSVLIEEVLQGAAELVARDGQPRNLSTLLKFEARIKGAFDSTSSGITTQDIFVKPRMLKDIKAALDKGSFTFINEGVADSPRIVSLGLDSVDFTGWNTSIWNSVNDNLIGNLTVGGDRLLLDGQTASDIKVSVAVIRGDTIYRLDHASGIYDGPTSAGCIELTPIVASVNTLVFESKPYNSFSDNGVAGAWEATSVDPLARPSDVVVGTEPVTFAPVAGDKLVVTVARPLSSGSGYATASKEAVIA